MSEGKPGSIMAELNLSGPQRRRSPRFGSPPQANAEVKTDKMALTSVAVKRSITVRKIAPRKTVAPSEQNKENRPSRVTVGSKCDQQKKPNVSTPSPVPGPGDSSAKKKKKKAAMPSPILPSSPPSRPQRPAVDPEDAVWTQKVRRSYSRLSENSLNSPDSRETFFGFGMLKTPVVGRRAEQSKTGIEVSGSLAGLNSFTSLLEADDCGSALLEPDTNIPGVVLVKEKRRRRKIKQIDDTELEAMAAKMNAEFDQAEVFELVVE